MKTKTVLGLLVATVAVFALSTQAMALHHGGVAHCNACHTMHNSFEGDPMTANTAVGTANAYLLIGSDQSSTCLNCHYSDSAGSYHIDGPYTADEGVLNMTPGGDFAWVNKTFSWVAWGSPRSSEGDRHGHNVVAADFSHTADATLTTSPGGSYANTDLHCSSCHDPHGKYRILDDAGTIGTTGLPIGESGSYPGAAVTATEALGVYRFLGGSGYSPASLAGSHSFTADPPAAVVPSTYNRGENTTETRVAYGSGMSEWCGNCHGGFHNDDYPTNVRHPAGNSAKLTADVVANYNDYVKSGDLTGDVSTSYTSLVPFESGATYSTADRLLMDADAVNDGSRTAGVSTSDNVMCLSCHRAHASGWDSMLRWNGEDEELTKGGVFDQDGRTELEVGRAYNDRDLTHFATYQRSLCNKCHAKD